jgi:cytoskeletal protein CcmA (bactofilin family)
MASASPVSSTCVIGPRIAVRGSIAGDEDLVIEGRVEGSVSLTGHLVVAEPGTVEANLEATSVEVHGEVVGDIVASRSVEIERTARVHGNIRAPRVIIRDGAQFRGRVEMVVDLPEGLLSNRSRGR